MRSEQVTAWEELLGFTVGAQASLPFPNYYLIRFNIFSSSNDPLTIAFCHMRISIHWATCTLSFDNTKHRQPCLVGSLFSLCIQLLYNPESTLLQSLLKSDILIKSLALVTIAHISSVFF